MKKLIVTILLVMSSIMLCNSVQVFASISNQSVVPDVYSVYDEDFNLLFQKDLVELGDEYMSKDFRLYEVVYVDDNNKMGLAKFVRNVEVPRVDISYVPKPISTKERKICMYMTHNDESYLPSDGVDSVYGNGGIKDVALAFKSELEKNLINVYFDDTLHIPHDTSAYSRSSVTAKSLYNNHKPDAIFDIHRDATSRKFYVANVNGEERCKVRIVIGKSNPNRTLNEEFAMYVVAVANEMYPWLITDIYYGGGHYNQSLDGKALLFEMGTYLMEKEKVIASTKELADVVTTALYGTTVNEETGDLTINGVEDEKNVVINEYIAEKQKVNWGGFALTISLIFFAGVCCYVTYVLIRFYRVKNSK